jgi:hypothetical protein
MRQLWRDIDESKQKAGLGTAPESPPSPAWDLAGMLRQATVLATDAAAWVSSAVAAPCALLASGAALLRDVPVLGRIAALVATSVAAPRPAPARGVEAHVTRGTRNGARPEPRSSEPNGEYLH